jgi:hypothetical protein
MQTQNPVAAIFHNKMANINGPYRTVFSAASSELLAAVLGHSMEVVRKETVKAHLDILVVAIVGWGSEEQSAAAMAPCCCVFGMEAQS